jgi:two-component system, NtrC family, sensor histidine kinase HydH
MRFPAYIQPRYIIAITIAVAIVMVTSTIIELQQSRAELYHVMEEEALSLAETIDISSSNNLLSMEHIEDIISERLFNNAFFVARLDSLGLLTNAELTRLAAANHIFRINIFDRRGKKVLTSRVTLDTHEGTIPRNSPVPMIAPILSGETDRLVIGFKEARFENGQRYAVAIRRTRAGGGAIVLNLNADDLLEFRKAIGIGRLISDLGDNSGIEYAALQDTFGIVAATKSVIDMSSIHADSFLYRAYETDSVLTRVTPFQDRTVLEVIKPFHFGGATVGLFRIGLSMDEIRAIETRMQRRAVIVSAVLLIIGALVLLAIVALQNFKLMERKYGVIRTFTGDILEHMHDAVITVDAGDRITIFNKQAEALLAVQNGTLVGRPLDTLNEHRMEWLPAFLAAPKPYAEMTIQTRAGEREVAVSFSETRQPDGQSESRTVVIRDLTDARRMEREISRRGKLTAMGELASGVAHEVRNPLNAINLIVQRIQTEFMPRKGAKEYQSLTSVLRSEVQRVNSIIQQFLRFARPAKPNLQPVVVDELVAHVATLFKEQATARGIAFSVSSKVTTPLSADRDQLTQAILNLLQNALEASPSGGKVELHAFEEDESIVISIRDHGKGIPSNELERIFDLYYTTKPDGTGMGLAITHQIVAQHQGTIAVESEVGKGTHFVMRFPR